MLTRDEFKAAAISELADLLGTPVSVTHRPETLPLSDLDSLGVVQFQFWIEELADIHDRALPAPPTTLDEAYEQYRALLVSRRPGDRPRTPGSRSGR